jgi:catechol 2,3-dioxygenase-like lactoylglutathione lyase family enzyme
MLSNLLGLDHIVVLVRDLARASATWRDLGFTLSPRGTHSAHLGTGNHTIMLGPDYIELSGVLTETDHNAPSRAFLASRGEGIERSALTCRDAGALVDEIRSLGFEPDGPLSFSRPVDLPGGGQEEARFRTVKWPLDERPGGLRLFACEHLTPDVVWVPDLQRHANSAKRIRQVEVAAPDPRGAADHLARLIAGMVEPDRDGSYRVPTRTGRADIVFATRAALLARHPGLAVDDLNEEGAAGLVIDVQSLHAATQSVRGGLVRDGGITVRPAAASGVALHFIQD